MAAAAALEVGTDKVPLLNLFVNDDNNNNPHNSQCALLDKHLSALTLP